MEATLALTTEIFYIYCIKQKYLVDTKVDCELLCDMYICVF